MRRVHLGLISIGLILILTAGTALARPGGRRGGARSAAGRGGRAPSRSPGRMGPAAPAARPGSAASHRPTAGSLGGVRPPAGPIGGHGANLPGTPAHAAGPRPPAPPRATTRPGQFHGAAANFSAQFGQVGANGLYRAGSRVTAYGVNVGGAAPFSAAWYAQHPSAWQITHPYAGGVLVATTAVGLARFLAIEPVVVSTGGTTETDDYDAEPTPEEAAEAAELARTGNVAVAEDVPWMPVGVFAFRPADYPQATRMIHLAVSPDGTLRGSHYDLISEDTANLIGAVDKSDGRVSWTMGTGGNVVFESTLADLTGQQGRVVVHFPDGQSGQWTLTRFENSPAE